MASSLALRLCHLLVLLASRIVPAGARERWRREWEAELASGWREVDPPGGSPGRALRLFKRSLIAVRDAFDARSRQRDRTGPEDATRDEPRGPAPALPGRGRRPRRGGGLLEDLLRDIRFGARSLLQRPGFAAVAVVTIALGIAANATIFSLVDGILLQPLAYDEPERIVVVWPEMWYSHSMLRTFEESASSYESLALFGPRSVIEITGDGARRLPGPRATSAFFDVLGVEPLLGRTFAEGEDRPEADGVAVISHGFWQRRFGGDPDVLGRRLRTSEMDRTIVGVMPEGFSFPWFLLGDDPELAVPHRVEPDSASFRSQDWKLVGRLSPGVTLAEASAELRVITDEWRRQFDLREDWNASARVVSLHEFLVGDVRPTLLLLFGAVGLILLIATANVANLLLARALSREREVSVRLALGAGPARVVRQLLTESTLLGLLGAVPGFVASIAGLRAVSALLPATTPRLDNVGVDATVLGFCVLVALGTGWLVGLVPALHLSRTNLRDGLVSGSRSATVGRRRRWLRSGIVVAEIGLAVMLVAGAGLLVKSFWLLNRVDIGIRADGLVKFEVTPTADRVTEASVGSYFTQIEQELESIAGVRSAATIWRAPLAPDGGITGFWPAGDPPEGPEDRAICRYRPIGEDYFRVAGIPLIEGRAFTAADFAGGENVAILSRSAADALFPGRSALGERVQVNMPEEEPATVVGVVGDVRIRGPAAEAPAVVYRPYPQGIPAITPFGAWGRTFVLRIEGSIPELEEQVRQAVRAIDANALVSEYESMPAAISASLTGRRVTMILLGVFTSVALVLAAVGIYGLMAWSVRSRARELSIRVALGASGPDVLRHVLRDGLRTAALGATAGIALALAASRFVETFVFEVAPTDPWVLGGAAGMAVFLTLLASLAPALRAVRSDPREALVAG